MAKYYAVKSGRTTGIFRSWGECEAQVKGFANARYKSFTTLEQAQAYLKEDSEASFGAELKTKVFGDKVLEQKALDDKAIAYVDGSFNQSTQEYGSGAVLFYQDSRFAFSKAGNDSKLVSMRNVAGEIIAATAVIGYCLSHKIPALDIYYDYEGIRAWALGEWKANKDGTREYVRFYKEASQRVKVNFIKVKAHSGDEFNDEADRLAKQAIGL